MNRLFSFALVLLLLFTCTACVGSAASPGADAGQTESLDADVPPPPEEEPPVEAEQEPEEPYIRVIDPARPMVALTFDDGPHGTYSDEILDILEENHALATFFEVGVNIWEHPEPLVRMKVLGCEIGSHSNAHNDLSKMTKANLLADLDAVDVVFSAIGVKAPTLVRPPYGAVNKAVKSATGRAIITWTVDTEDWKSRDAQTVVDYVKNYGNLDGEIVLMHSTYQSTVDAVRELIPWLQEQGYQLVTVTELLAFYYGELPQPNHFYGYTYFTTHERTDAPVELPSMFRPTEEPVEAPAVKAEPAEITPAEPEPDPIPGPEPEPIPDPKPEPDPKPVSNGKYFGTGTVPNPALFNP